MVTLSGAGHSYPGIQFTFQASERLTRTLDLEFTGADTKVINRIAGVLQFMRNNSEYFNQLQQARVGRDSAKANSIFDEMNLKGFLSGPEHRMLTGWADRGFTEVSDGQLRTTDVQRLIAGR